MDNENQDVSADTEGEAPPPVLPALGNRAIGKINSKPVKIIEEAHKKNYVKIFIYEVSGSFFYGYQLRVDRIIRQKKANSNETPLSSTEAARIAARDEIKRICGHSRFIRDIFEDFTMIKYNQGELF